MTASPGRDRVAGDDRVERHEADRAAGELEPVDDVAELGDLAAGDLDPGRLGARGEADADLLADPGSALRQRMKSSIAIGSAPTQTRSLTFIATQSMPIVSKRPSSSATSSLVPDPVGGEGDPALADPDHARVVARQRHLIQRGRGLSISPPGHGQVRRRRNPLRSGRPRLSSRPRSSLPHPALARTAAGNARPVGRVGPQRPVALDQADQPLGGEGRGEGGGDADGQRAAQLGRGAAAGEAGALERGGADDDRQRDRPREQVRLVAGEAAPAGGGQGDAVARDAGASAAACARPRARPSAGVASPRPRRCGRVSATSIAAAPASRPTAVARGPPSRRSIGRSQA